MEIDYTRKNNNSYWGTENPEKIKKKYFEVSS